MLAFFRAPVKLVSRESDRLVFRLDSREYDALRAAVALRSHLTRRPRPLTGDTAIPAALREAEAELSVALAEHRQDLTTGVDALLNDPARCAAQSRGVHRLTLSTADANLLLQALGDLRMGAWERLGCPDFEAGERPGVNEDNFLCLWAMQVSDLFQAHLLRGLMGDD